MEIREELIAQFENGMPAMRQVTDACVEIAALQEKKENILKKKKAGWTILFWFASMIVLGIPLEIVNAVIGAIFKGDLRDSLTVILELILVVAAVIATIKIRKFVQKKADTLEENEIAPAFNKLAELMQQPSLAFLPESYRFPSPYETLYGYFKDMRANTIQEAVNLYEDELRQQQQLEQLKALQAQVNAADAADTLRTIGNIGRFIGRL